MVHFGIYATFLIVRELARCWRSWWLVAVNSSTESYYWKSR